MSITYTHTAAEAAIKELQKSKFDMKQLSSMSPAFTARFTWYSMLPGNRQVGRSIHFLVMCAFVVFTIAHVIMVVLTGFARNMNHAEDHEYFGELANI